MTNENNSKPEVNNPLVDNKSIDLIGIMNITGSLLKNPEVLNTVSDVMKLTNSVPETSNKPEELEKNTFSASQNQIAELNQQIIELQNKSIDLSGFMNIAGSLLKNPEVLNTVSDVMKLTNSVPETSSEPEELEKNKISASQNQIAELNQQIIELQNQIAALNQHIIELQNQISINNKELKDILLKLQKKSKK